jgi:hypothetical protein
MKSLSILSAEEMKSCRSGCAHHQGKDRLRMNPRWKEIGAGNDLRTATSNVWLADKKNVKHVKTVPDL